MIGQEGRREAPLLINDFISEVMAQSGKKISVPDANDLIAAANAILAAI